MPLAFETQPKNVRVDSEESFVLECKPNQEASCYWTQNRKRRTLIGSSIAQSQQENDYTIYILNATNEDQGNWQCKCHSPAKNVTVVSDIASVIITPRRRYNTSFSTEASKLTTETLPRVVTSNIIANVGEDFVLDCGSENDDFCFWNHNGKRIQLFSHSRQSYLMQNASYWSIRIRDAEEDDQGVWKCTCKGKDPLSTLKSTTTTVIVRSSKGPSSQLAITMHPQHVIVQEDDPFDLRCSFSHNVRCIWRQVALPWIVTRFELHHLLSECILNVAKTSLRDAGWWSCSGVNITNSTIYVESDFVMVLVIPKSPIDDFKDDGDDSNRSPKNPSPRQGFASTKLPTTTSNSNHQCSFTVLTVLSVLISILALAVIGLLVALSLKRNYLFDSCLKRPDSVQWNVHLISNEGGNIA